MTYADDGNSRAACLMPYEFTVPLTARFRIRYMPLISLGLP